MRKSDMKMFKNKINKYTPSPETTVTHVIEISPFPLKIFHDITTPQSASTRIFVAYLWTTNWTFTIVQFAKQ